MTEDKSNAPESVGPTTPPPTIKPRKAVPRPPGPPAAGAQISTEHFALPEVDLDSLSKMPDFAGITSSPVSDAPAPEAVRHSAEGTPTGATKVEYPVSDPEVQDPTSAEDSTLAAVGAKMKGWAGSALDSVKSMGSSKDDEDEMSAEPVAETTTQPSAAPYAFTPGGSTGTTAASPVEPTAERPAAEPRPAPTGGPRKVRLAIARLDPWSVMKLSFLMSVAMGIMLVVAAWVFWYALNDLGVFTSIDELISGIVGQESADLDILQYLARDKVMSVATLIAVVDVVLLTALATIGAFLYNIVAALVGGIHMTMSDD